MLNTRLVFAVAFVLAVFRGSPGAETPQGIKPAGVDAQRLHDYRALCAGLERDRDEKMKGVDTRTKDGWQKKIDALRNIIGASSEEKLDLICYGLVATSELSRFEDELLQTTTGYLINKGDRLRLVKLLSGRPPRNIFFSPLEWTLVTSNKIPDGIVIVEESYEKAVSPEAKKVLVDVYASAFPSIRKSVKEDDVFVKEVVRWYQENRDRLEVNDAYYSAATDLPPFSQGSVELFKLRPLPK